MWKEVFSHYFLGTFSTPFSYSSLSRTPIMGMFYFFIIVAQDPKTFIYLFWLSLSIGQIRYFVLFLSSPSLILFSFLLCYQVHLLSFLLRLLYLLVYYFSLYFLFLYWCFLFFFSVILISLFIVACLRHFYHCWFKISVTPVSSRCWHLWVVFFHSVWNLPGSWYNECLLKLDFLIYFSCTGSSLWHMGFPSCGVQSKFLYVQS